MLAARNTSKRFDGRRALTCSGFGARAGPIDRATLQTGLRRRHEWLSCCIALLQRLASIAQRFGYMGSVHLIETVEVCQRASDT